MLRTILILSLLALSSGCESASTSEEGQAPTESFTEGVTDVVPLKYASADELASTLNRLVDPQHRGVGARFVADPRTNSLVVMVKDQNELAKVHELIQQLDVETPKAK